MATQQQTHPTGNKKAARLLELGLTPVLLGNRGETLKRPQLTDWQTAVVTPEEVATWPAHNNVGMRCGLQADGRHVYVFDFDKYARQIFPAWRAEAEQIIGAPLVIVATGKGYHALVSTAAQQDGGLLAGETIEDPDGKTRTDTIIEVRGERQQVVCAGSLHPNGHRYKFLTGTTYSAIPSITTAQYRELCALAETYDKRTRTTVKTSAAAPLVRLAATGELATVDNCIDYADRYIAFDERAETTYIDRTSGQRVTAVKYGGNGGLFVWERGWFSHSESVGGGLVDLVAWHKRVSRGEAWAMLRTPGAHRARNESETGSADRFTLYPGNHALTIELHDGQFLGDVDVLMPDRALLLSKTGTGKTSAAVNIPGNIVLVLPTQALIEQLYAKYSAAVYYQHMKTVTAGENPPLILTTPDSLPFVRELIDETTYTMVVDEAHQIALANYRKRAYDNVVRAIDGAWARVLLMTGTAFPLVTQRLEMLETVAVQSRARMQPIQRIVYSEQVDRKRPGAKTKKTVGDALATLRTRLAPHSPVRYFLRADNKGALADAIYHTAIAAGFPHDTIAFLNSDTRDTLTYRTLVRHEQIPEDVRVVIATSVVETGVNIRGADAWEVHFLTPVSSIEIEQTVNRWRDRAPVAYWYNSADGEHITADMARVGKRVAADAVTLADELTRFESEAANDAAMQSYIDMRLRELQQLYTAQLVELVVDEHGWRTWQPSPVGCSYAVFRHLKTAECNNPEVMKRNLAAYGFVWQDDARCIISPSKEERAARNDYVEEKEEERQVYLAYLAEELKLAGAMDVHDKLRKPGAQVDSDYRFLGKLALDVHAIINTDRTRFDVAVAAALLSRGRDRRASDLLRRLHLQRERDTAPLAGALYGVFEVGDRVTNVEMQAFLTAQFERDPLQAVLLKPRGRKDAPLSTNKAVRLFSDYFELKRCKIYNAAGERINAYEIVDLVPEVSGVNLRPFLPPDVSLSSMDGLATKVRQAVEERNNAASETAAAPKYAPEVVPIGAVGAVS